jgi:hypothetical protein
MKHTSLIIYQLQKLFSLSYNMYTIQVQVRSMNPPPNPSAAVSMDLHENEGEL